MSNSRNWVAQKDCPYAAGSVDVATGATAENPGDATFAQAFGAGPIDVYWMVEDSNNPPRSMAGKGSLSGGTVDVSSPMSTFDGTTYDNAPSAAITLTSPVIIRCTLNARVFDEEVVFTDDSRLSDARTPTAHAASHGTGQADEVTPAAIGAATSAQGVLADSALQDLTGSPIGELSNVVLTTPANTEVLTYNGTNWVNAAPGAPSLTNATFDTYAVFDAEVDNTGTNPTVDFATGNKQRCSNVAIGNITLAAAPGIGNYILRLIDSTTHTFLTTIRWDSGTAPTWAGESIVALYWDGTNWSGSAMVGVA